MPEPNYESELREHRAILHRDDAVFARWLANHEERLRMALRSYARVVDVEVVVQETALRVWQLTGRIVPDGRPGFVMRWAVTVARNLARDMIRRARRELPLTDDADERIEAAPPVLPDPALARHIRDCREALPTSPARVLDGRIAAAGTLSDRALAESMGMGFDAFRKNLSRGRRLLEDCLKRHGIDLRSVLA